jgi:hypothetical protein
MLGESRDTKGAERGREGQDGAGRGREGQGGAGKSKKGQEREAKLGRSCV